MKAFAIAIAWAALIATGMMISAIVFIVLHIDWIMEV